MLYQECLLKLSRIFLAIKTKGRRLEKKKNGIIHIDKEFITKRIHVTYENYKQSFLLLLDFTIIKSSVNCNIYFSPISSSLMDGNPINFGEKDNI